jgi:hypothetical protein
MEPTKEPPVEITLAGALVTPDPTVGFATRAPPLRSGALANARLN